MRDVNRNADRTGYFAQNSKALGNAGCVSKMDRTKLKKTIEVSCQEKIFTI